MESIVYELLLNKHYSFYLTKSYENDVKHKDIKNIMRYLNNGSLDFALIDLGDQNLNNSIQSQYVNIFEVLEIPYFTIELPDHIKIHYSNILDEINYKLAELNSTYSALKNKNLPKAQELKFLIDKYSKDIEEIERYLNLKWKPQKIINKILMFIKDSKQNEITFVYIGDEKTFPSIMKLLKRHKVNSNVLFVQKS